MNLFGTVLTHTAPSSNYRGESAENRTIIQKITKGRFEYAIISPEAIRNAIRETFQALGLPCNRQRLNNEDQIAVKFVDFPDENKYVDDFFMGWLIADRKKIEKGLKDSGRDPKTYQYKRDSVLRMNMAVALEPYRHDSVFTQSPQNVDSAWKNADNSQLLHRETAYTSYQYPFALNLDGCKQHQDWTKALIKAIGELNGVSGNHARSYFEFSPESIVLRLSNSLVAGYNTYGFNIDDDEKHTFSDLVEDLIQEVYPGNEFYFGGKIVKDFDEKTKEILKSKGVHLHRSPQHILQEISEKAFED